MTSVPELVALLYRADWRQLCLSARITSQHDRTVDEQLLQRVAADRGMRQPPGRYIRSQHGDPHEEDDEDEDEEDPDADWPDTERMLLLAPGGRYRVSAGAGDAVAICDGESRWLIHGGAASRLSASGPDPAFHGLLTPQWLVTSYHLVSDGRTDIAGRPAHHLLASPRAGTCASGASRHRLLDRVDALVDAELGILLRSEQVFGGQTLKLSELHDLIVDPPQAADPGMFAPPPGMPVEDEAEPTSFLPHGRGWQAAAAAAGLAATAMGLAARYYPRRARQAPADAEAAMPRDARPGASHPASGATGTRPGASGGGPGATGSAATGSATSGGPGSPTGGAAHEPVSDELVNLLHRTGLPAQDLTAELHEWADIQAVMRGLQSLRSKLPQPIDGILGPDALWEALVRREQDASSTHRTARLRVRMPGEYRIDHLTGDWNSRYITIACDGARTRKVYRDRIATGAVTPLKAEIAALIDPAWLLRGWRLSASGEVTVAGRPGFGIRADACGESGMFGQWLASDRLEVVVDAELGILLRQTVYLNETPAMRSELRAVSLANGDASADSRLDASADSRLDASADFGLEDIWGLRAVTDAGGLLGDRNLPTPVQAAGTAAALAVGGAIAGAIAVTGWLEKHRPKRD